MSIRMLIRSHVCRMGLLFIVAALIVSPSVSFGEVMTMSPHKISLNAVGQFDDVQAVIRMSMKSGYVLADYSVILKFNDVPVSEAYDFSYCYIDANFLASFDRTALQANPDVTALAGQTVTATVEGWFSAENDLGESYTQSFSFNDRVEILDPEKSIKSIDMKVNR